MTPSHPNASGLAPSGPSSSDETGEARPTTGKTHWIGRVATLVVTGLLVSAAFVAGRSSGLSSASDSTVDAETTTSSGPLPVNVITVEPRQSYEIAREYVGRVESARQSDLAFERAGRIEKMLVDEGETVAAGAEIGHLDTELLKAERAVRAARVAAEKARLEELQAGPRAEAITAAEADVAQLKADLQLARLTESRQGRLFQAGSAPEQRFDEARLAAASLEARLASAQARLDELNNGTRAEQITAQQAALARAEAELAAINVDITKSVLLAPFDGEIAMRSTDEGEVVSPGQTVVHLIETSKPELRVGVPGNLVDRLTAGGKLPVVIHGQSCEAKLLRTLPQRDDDLRTVDVVLGLCSGANAPVIRDGDMVSMTLETSVADSGYWLPIAALAEGVRGLWSCYVVRDEDGSQVIGRVPLEVIHATQDRAFVDGPLASGDQVVVSGTHRLVPGLEVTVASSEVASSVTSSAALDRTDSDVN